MLQDSLLIRSALIDGEKKDLLIQGNRIAQIAQEISVTPDVRIIDADGKALLPGFANMHTHSAMTLFRGYGDDLPLQSWLEEYIWPVEAHMTDEDIYWGSMLGILEMIQSGTTLFLDMYGSIMATAQAAEELGIRAALSYTFFDRGDRERACLDRKNALKYYHLFEKLPETISYALGPHAIYTVSLDQLKFCREFSDEYGVPVHFHLSETIKENQDCLAQYGKTPVRLLNDYDALNKHFVMAHSLYLDDEELDIIAQRGCSLVHNPASNMKLASGAEFRYEEMKQRNIRVGIGTDGTSSSNNLDMFQAMRYAALLGKVWRKDPTANSAQDIYYSATRAGYEMLGLNGGKIEVGALADLILVDTRLPEMTPCHNLTSNLVYSASGSVVDTTIVNGKVLMQNRHIPQADRILEKASEAAYNLIKKYGIHR